MGNCGVYEIVNLHNGKRYVGSSKDLKAREYRHFSGSQSNPHMQYAMKKYGKDKFVFKVLEYVREDDLLKVEQFYIDALNPEYNICRVAGNRLGVPMSDEAKAKVSQSLKGRIVSGETREKLRKANTGKKASPETIEKLVTSHLGKKLPEEQVRKIAAANRGKAHPPMSDEAKLKISLSRKGKKLSEETKQKMRMNRVGMKGKKHSDESKAKMSASQLPSQVLCVSNGVTYKSVKDAADQLDLNLISIYKVISKSNRALRGLVFQWVENGNGGVL